MPNLNKNGQIDSVFLPELVINIFNQQISGILELNSGSELKIYFDKGIPFFAEGGEEETLLARILLDHNKITKDQYDKIIQEISDKDIKVGELVVSMGILNPHELNEFLEIQVTEKIIRGLTYTKGEYRFSDTNDFPANAFYCRLNLHTIIYETLNRYADTSRIDINGLNIKSMEDFGTKIPGLNLGPRELRISQLINKHKRLSDIVERENVEKEKLLSLVLFLSLYEIIDIENFSVSDFCLSSFEKLHHNKIETVEKSESEDEAEIIELEEEILEDAEKEEATEEDSNRIKLEADSQQDTQIQQNSVFEGDLQGNRNEIEIGKDGNTDDSETVSEHNKMPDSTAQFSDEQVPEKGIEIGEDSNKNNEEIEAQHNTLQDAKMQFSDEQTPEQGIEIGEESNNKQQGSIIGFDDKYTDRQEVELEADSGHHVLAEDPESELKQDEPGTTGKSDEVNKSQLSEITAFYEFVSDEDDSFKILGVEKDTDDNIVKDAYFKLVKKFHPDANPHFPKDIRIKAETIFTKVTQAYESIATEAKRESYEYLKDADSMKDKAQAIYEAEIMYNEGELLLRQRRYKDAVKKFSNAVELNPEEAAYIGALSWARFLSYDNKDSIIKDSIKELEKATSMNQNIAENYYYLGSLYKHKNNTAEAEKNFEKAVGIDPHYIQAKRELRLLKNRKQENKKDKGKSSEGSGFWSSLFKK